MLTNIQLTLFM